FARNVLRKIRREPTRFEWARNWFSVRKIVGASAVAWVFFPLFFFPHYPGPRTTSSSDTDVVTKIDPQDYDVVADLDALIAWDENTGGEDNPPFKIFLGFGGFCFCLLF